MEKGSHNKQNESVFCNYVIKLTGFYKYYGVESKRAEEEFSEGKGRVSGLYLGKFNSH